MSEGDDVSRLRAIVAVFEASSLTELVWGDCVLKRPAPSPLERVMRQSTSGGDDDSDRDEIAEEERRERDLEKDWRSYWARATASSGADVPPFPGVEQAMRFFHGRA